MAQTYYDSAFTGAQIDAAVRSAAAIAAASVPQNSGKLISVNVNGDLIAIDSPGAYDDTELAARIDAVESRLSSLLDATGEEF